MDALKCFCPFLTIIVILTANPTRSQSVDSCAVRNLSLCPDIQEDGRFIGIQVTFETADLCSANVFTVSIQSDSFQSSFQIQDSGRQSRQSMGRHMHQVIISEAALPDKSGRYQLGVYSTSSDSTNSSMAMDLIDIAYIYGCSQMPTQANCLRRNSSDSCCQIKCRFACNIRRLSFYNLIANSPGRQYRSSGLVGRMDTTVCLTGNVTFAVEALNENQEVLPPVRFASLREANTTEDDITGQGSPNEPTSTPRGDASNPTIFPSLSTGMIVVSVSASLAVVLITVVAAICAAFCCCCRREKVNRTSVSCTGGGCHSDNHTYSPSDTSLQCTSSPVAQAPESCERIPSAYYDTIDSGRPPNIVVISPIDRPSYRVPVSQPTGETMGSHSYEDIGTDVDRPRPSSTSGSEDTYYTSVRSLQRLRGELFASLHLSKKTNVQGSTTLQVPIPEHMEDGYDHLEKIGSEQQTLPPCYYNVPNDKTEEVYI